MGIRRVALVWTAYQANILKCIIEQTAMPPFDLIFVRDKIAGKTDIEQMAAKVAVLKDVYLSIREFLKAEAQIKTRIERALPPGPFELWICNYEGPYGQRILSDRRCTKVFLFEEGTGSYLRPEFVDLTYGIKTALTLAVTRAIYLKNGNGLKLLPEERVEAAWSLFPGSFPRLRVPNRIISHDTFHDVLERGASGDGNGIAVKEDSAIYLAAPLSECKLVSREIDVAIVRECFAKFLQVNANVSTVLWKPHPVSSPDHTTSLAGQLSQEFGVDIQVIGGGVNFEQLIFGLRSSSAIPVFSTTSSSLYVAEVLSKKGLKVSSVKSRALIDAIKPFRKIYEMFDRIGIDIID